MKYNKKILYIKHGSFPSHRFTIKGTIRNECKGFISRLSELLPIKRIIPKSIVVSWVQMKIKLAQIRTDVNVFERFTNN